MDTGYGKHYGLCAICQDESKRLPLTELICDDCQREHAETISTDAAWIVAAKEEEAKHRRRERTENYHVPIRVDDGSVQSLPAFIRDMFSVSDVSDNPIPGTLDHFVEQIEPLRNAWLVFDRHQVPGFSFSKFKDAQNIMALIVHIIMHSKVEHGQIPPKEVTPQLAAGVMNIIRARYGLDSISHRRFQQLKGEAEQKIRVFKRSGRVLGSAYLLKRKD